MVDQLQWTGHDTRLCGSECSSTTEYIGGDIDTGLDVELKVLSVGGRNLSLRRLLNRELLEDDRTHPDHAG